MSSALDINEINNIPLGKLQSWETEKETAISPVPFPARDAGFVKGVDTLGVVKTFTIRTRMTGVFSVLQGRINAIENIADGHQRISVPFRSVFINGHTAEYVAGAWVKVRREGIIGKTSDSTSEVVLHDTNGLFKTKGVRASDRVKNLITNQVTTVTHDPSDEENLILFSDIGLKDANIPYAVSSTIRVKVMGVEVNWEIPGLSWVDLTLELIQVRD